MVLCCGNEVKVTKANVMNVIAMIRAGIIHSRIYIAGSNAGTIFCRHYRIDYCILNATMYIELDNGVMFQDV